MESVEGCQRILRARRQAFKRAITIFHDCNFYFSRIPKFLSHFLDFLENVLTHSSKHIKIHHRQGVIKLRE